MAILSLQIEVEAGSILQQDFAAAGKILIHGCLLQGQKLYGFFVSMLPIQIFEGNKTDPTAHSPLISQNRKRPSRSSIFSSFFTTAASAVTVW
ncbi:hypothetical protein M5689_020655 [Euphorbia peplus]|nr:hypothetical protein M5689_020655 [Euphorbia peplus]